MDFLRVQGSVLEVAGEDVDRGIEVMGGSGPGVQAVGDGVEVPLTVDREIGAFGQVLPNQAVGVFGLFVPERGVIVVDRRR